MSLEIHELAAKFKASGRNWDQLCQAGIVNASIWSDGFVGTYGSAIEAYRASKIISTDPKKASLGDVHYWSIGRYGHVAGQLENDEIFMCSKYVDKFWGINVGTTTVDAYTKRTGARYLGWAKTNGTNKIHLTSKKVKADAKSQPKPPVKKPTKSYDLVLPSESLQIRIQKALARHGFYNGPADGEFGVLSFTGIQKALAEFAGYKGAIDGDIEEDGARHIQTFAKKKGGYEGKIDKKLGPYSWSGFATALERTP